jgi:hypothetical protein
VAVFTTDSGMVSPASLRPVGTGFTGPTAPDINNAKSRFSCWLEARVPYEGFWYKQNSRAGACDVAVSRGQ